MGALKAPGRWGAGGERSLPCRRWTGRTVLARGGAGLDAQSGALFRLLPHRPKQRFDGAA